MVDLRLLPHGLVRQIAVWTALSTAIGLVAFACVAVVVVIYEEEAEPDRDPPEVILREAREEVGQAMMIAAPIGLLLAVGGAAIATRRALTPLAQVVQSAAQITPHQLRARLPLPAAEGEVRSVVLALNELFARLEAGFAALDRFAADASHELRTPLTVISTELEVMLQGTRTNEQWEASALVCLDEVRQLARLVSALLDMARSERKRESEEAKAELRGLVDRALSTVAPLARSRGVRVETALGVELERSINADSAALQSALLNVVENAVRYTPAGGQVRVWSLLGSRDTVLLHVDDNGPGIELSEREHVFKPFARSAAGNSVPAGFGLGLTIARRICEHHRITLSVGRSPSGGARLSFTFPIHDTRQPPVC